MSTAKVLRFRAFYGKNSYESSTSVGDVTEPVNGHRSTHKFRDLKSLRMRIKPRMSQAKLAREAEVSPDTLRKAERGEAVTEAIATSVFDVLAKHLKGLSQENTVLTIND